MKQDCVMALTQFCIFISMMVKQTTGEFDDDVDVNELDSKMFSFFRLHSSTKYKAFIYVDVGNAKPVTAEEVKTDGVTHYIIFVTCKVMSCRMPQHPSFH